MINLILRRITFIMTSHRTLYDHGLPFSQILAENVKTQIERVDSKRASLIILDGAIGTGKTTLATEIMDYINSVRKLGEVSLEIKKHPQLALGGKEFTGCFRTCHKEGLPVVTYDEAGDFSRRGAITQFNMMINRVFETYRGFKIIVIICLPNFNILDNQLFDNQIPRLLIHITGRSAKYGDFSAYSLAQMNWIRYWYDKLPKGAKHKCFSKVEPNFRGHFLNLPKQREKTLDKLSTFGKTNLLKKTEIDMKGLYDYLTLANQTNRSINWVRDSLKSMKIKEVSIIDQKKYFDKSVLSALFSRMDELKENETRGRPKKE